MTVKRRGDQPLWTAVDGPWLFGGWRARRMPDEVPVGVSLRIGASLGFKASLVVQSSAAPGELLIPATSRSALFLRRLSVMGVVGFHMFGVGRNPSGRRCVGPLRVAVPRVRGRPSSPLQHQGQGRVTWRGDQSNSDGIINGSPGRALSPDRRDRRRGHPRSPRCCEG